MRASVISNIVATLMLAAVATAYLQADDSVRQQSLVQHVTATPTTNSQHSARMRTAMDRVGYPTHKKDEDTVLNRSFYSTAFNKKHCEAKWVMWALTPSMLGVKGRRYPFAKDTDLSLYDYQVEKSDYDESGYSRGHMMPAADCKFSTIASMECALMSNICPQTSKLNSGPWNSLEMKCREWAYTEDTLFIVCGPVYYSKSPKKIGRTHLVDVPDAFFKVVLSMRKGHEKIIGFVMTNTDTPTRMRESTCSVASIEEETGIVFFPKLDKKFKGQLDLSANYSKWKTPKQQNGSYNNSNYNYRKQSYRHNRNGAAKKSSGNR